MDIVTILKRTKKELIRKIITSVILQGLLLVIPVYWTNSINHATSLEYNIAFKLVIITLILSLLYYLWSYFNQRAWYNYYNKLYLEYTNLVTEANVNDITLIIIIYFGSKIEIENKNRKDNLDYKTINIHNIYDILKGKKRIKDNSFISSTIRYLESNAKFNLFVNGMIYLVLGFLELCRYGVIIYAIYLVSMGRMEIGTVLLIYSYYGKIITNFEVLGTINAEYQSVKVSINRLNRIKSNKEIYE